MMLDQIVEWITFVATLIGFLVLVWVAICVFCLMAFTIIMAVDHIQVARRSKAGRHNRRDSLDISENQLFFERLREEEAEELAYTGPPTTGGMILPQPQSIAERKAQEALVAEQRARVGYSTPAPTPAPRHDDATMVYPAFDPEQTVVGMTPRYSTPSDGLQLVADEEMLHPYEYPFNVKDGKNDASSDRPA